MNFKRWLNELYDGDEQFLNPQYINPDQIYHVSHDDERTTPFIYTIGTKQIYYGSSFDIHADVVRNNVPLRQLFKNIDRRSNSYHLALFGRVGPLYYHDSILVVSFWDNNENLFNRLIPGCLKQLAQDGKIDLSKDALSTINHGTLFIRDFLNSQNKGNKATPEEIEKQKLAQQLHLMQPAQKKIAMAKLGLATGNKKNAWQDAAEKSRIAVPGHKFWALNSEGTI